MIKKYIQNLRKKSKEEKLIYTFFWSVFFTSIFVFFNFFTPYINIDQFIESTVEYKSFKNDNLVNQENINISSPQTQNLEKQYSVLDDIKTTFSNIKDSYIQSKNLLGNIQLATNTTLENVKNQNQSLEYLRKKTNNIEDTNSSINLNIKGINFKVYLAKTQEEQALGLSYSNELCSSCAMLFIFDQAKTLSFWMKGMNYNIDLVYLDENGNVINIYNNLAPETYPKSFASSIPAKYAIEMEADMAYNIGLKVGDKINISY